MRPAIAGVWLTGFAIWNWLCSVYLYFVEKWKVFVPRNNGAVDQTGEQTKESTKACSVSTEGIAAGQSDSDPHSKYDVFLSHRGPDVKLKFVAHLNDALRRGGLHPFLDAKSIRVGSHVFRSIDEAVSRANVHVAIFSTGYADSKHCLRELCAMQKSQKVIIPVFYDVKPENLRNIQSGPYAAGFQKHQSKGRHREVLEWKDALLQAADFRGFRMDEVRDENQLVRKIVVAVQRASPVNLQLYKGSPKFGLDESLEEVVHTMTKMGAENVGVLGLFGMGGIGKTCLAWEVYNHFISRREFQCHCFVKDVRSKSTLELQQQLVNDLLKQDMRSSSNNNNNYDHWFHTFRREKLLIVIDDIDTTSQFEDLIPDILGLTAGSRIVVTSRDRDVLDLATRPAKERDLYKVKTLNRMDSRRLFNWHAFYSEEAPSEGNFRKLAAEVADACRGHPLKLEVIGRLLYNKKDGPDDETIWTDSLKTLNENRDINETLEISYTRLPSDGDKAMFLDIACLMIGTRKDVAMELWASCHSCDSNGFCSTTKGPSQVLRRLQDRSLVHLDADLRFAMHDVIRDMGRNVVIKQSPKAPSKRTHLWDAATAAKVLSKNLGMLSRIRGIKLSTMESSKGTPTYVAEKFESMDELHLLILDGCLLTGEDYSKLSQELRWLQWRSFPGTQLPSGLDLPNLAVLDLTSSSFLSCLWQEDDRIELPALQRLILTNCKSLQKLPQNIGYSMPRVRTMEMDNCSRIVELPGSIGLLKDLEQLILSSCASLESLPDSVANLAKLKRVVLQDCGKLKQLPERLGRLFNLEFLNLSNCSELPRLPPSVEPGLRMLKELHMINTCINDGHLLTFVETLTTLTAFHLCQNQAITVLPQSLGDLKSLLRLQISNCPALETVEALPRSLQSLDMADCPQLSKFPSIAEATSLISLNLCNCKSLTQIGGLECLTALEEINIAGCTSLLQAEPQVIHPSRFLRMCYLSGSKVGLVYDNKWSEAEPAQQLISYYDESIGYTPNGMTQKLIAKEWCYESAAETTIICETKCLAVIFCFVVHDQGWSSFPWDHGHYNGNCYMEVWIMREGMRVYDFRLFTVRHADEHDQVYLCTFRRKHPFVQSLKVGDKICVHARSQYPGWRITVQEGAISVVHEDSNELHQAAIALNSNLQSTDLVSNFNNLVLVDRCSLSLESRFGDVESIEESKFESEVRLASEADSLSIDTQNPDQKEWLMEPAYGLYSWAHSWTLPRAGQGLISFVAQGRNDIRMAISEQRRSRHPMYQIIIGGWDNRGSVIRRTPEDGEECFVVGGLANPGGLNRLWVSIDARTFMIRVGRGDPFEDVIAVYRDTDFYRQVRYISFTTLDTPVTYSNVVLADLEHPTPVLDTYNLSQKVAKQDLNDAWTFGPYYLPSLTIGPDYSWDRYWTLPKPGRGVLSFTTEGSCEDIYVGISSCPGSMDTMYKIMIENPRTFILGGPLGPKYNRCVVEHNGRPASHINHLWVSLDAHSGIIQIGRGEPGQNMYCIYKDPAFLCKAQYFTFSTGPSQATVSNVAVSEILE